MHRFLSFLLRATAILPLRALHAVGFVLGWAMYGMSPTYRRHLRGNLTQAGFADGATRRAAIAAAGQLIAELPALWFRRREESLALVRSAEGVEAVLAARAAGKALLLLTPHHGCFEICAQYAAQHAPITVLYRAPKIAWLEPLMREGRGGANLRLVPADLSGVRELFRALERGEAAGFLPDQVPGLGEGEWTEYFGRPAYTMTLAAKLAERPNIACFLAYARRLPKGAGYRIVVRPFPKKDSSETATRRLNRALEELVGECPEQYLWGYNRYKTPAGAAPPPA
ncbi:MAG TPA: lysophospholipid acyltransferase family protein [Burkholderiales bacterium]